MKKMKLFSIFTILVIAVFTFVTCAKPAPAPAPSPAPSPTPAPAPAPAPEPIVLTYSDHNSATGWSATKADGPWMANIEKDTNGQVKFETYYGETLAKGVDVWEAVKTGVADIGWAFHGYWPGLTPLSDVVSLPFIPYKSAEQAAGAFWQLGEQFPSLNQEFDDVKVLFHFTTPPYYLITTEKQVNTVADLKGMKLRIIGGPPTDAFKALGAVPMLVPMPENYISMQKGILDGMGSTELADQIFKHYEVTKYKNTTALYVGYFTMAMNKQKFDSLPADVQAVFEKYGGLEGSKWYAKVAMDEVKGPLYEAMKQSGHEWIENEFSPAEYEKLISIAGRPVWDEWVKKMADAGHPEAGDILDTLLEMTK